MGIPGRLVLALTALCVVGCVMAGSALAGPKFQLGPGASYPAQLRAESKVVSSLNTFNLAGTPLECLEGTKISGEVTAARNVEDLTVELAGCRRVHYPGGEEVHTEGAPAGHIVLEQALKGGLRQTHPEWLGKVELEGRNSHRVALLLSISPTSIKSGSATPYQISGKLLIPITPVNTTTSVFGLTLNQSGGQQEWTTYEDTPSGGYILPAHLSMEVTGQGSTLQSAGLQAGALEMTAGELLYLEA